MSHHDDVVFLEDQLEQQRQNLRQLRSQQAVFAKGDERLSLLNQILAVEQAIRETKARLRQMGIEPERSMLDPAETFTPFPDHFIKQYPHPLAQACLIFNHEQADTTKQFIALDKLIVHLIKYLTGIFIGHARRDRPPEYPLPDRLQWLAFPNLEAWAEALQELSTLYSQSPWREKWRFDGLLDALTRPLVGQREVVEAIDYLTLRLDRTGLDEPSVIDFVQALAWHCQQEWPDAAGSYPTDKAVPLMLRLQPALITVLNQLEPLRRYPVIYLEWAQISDQTARLRPVKFMGQFTTEVTRSDQRPLTAPVEELPRIKAGRVYIADEAGLPLLALHPFFVVHRMSMYHLKSHRPSNYIEFRSCVNGTTFYPPLEASKFLTNWSHHPDEVPAEAEAIPPILGEDEEKIQQVEPIPSEIPGEPVPLTMLNPEGRAALEMALGEALRIGRFWLGLEFLLMALSRQTNSLFFRLLREMGLSPGELRGMLRGLAGVVASEEERWREQSVTTLGAEALPRLRQVNPAQLRPVGSAGAQPEPVITPRMMAVLQAAVKLADGAQVGPTQLLAAALRHHRAVAIQFFFSVAYQAGWSPEQISEWIIRLSDKSPDELAAEPLPPPPRRPDRTQRPPRPAQEGSVLAQLGRDLTQAAADGRLHPVAGQTARQAVAQIGRILLQRQANNPLLVGDPGVGKTAVVEGFAWRLLDQKRPVVKQLAGRRVIELSANAIASGTKYRGQLEERLEQLKAEVMAAEGEMIVFIDEIHNILGGGSNDAIAEALKPALARGEFPCIGATTVAEYRQYIEKDAALARRFTPIWLAEPTVDEAIAIVQTVATQHLAAHHQVSFEPAAIEAAVRLSARYLADEQLPGKAIKVLDEAASGLIVPGTLFEGDDTGPLRGAGGGVTVADVVAIIAERTNIPVSQLGQTDKQKLLALEERLRERIIGQDHAVSQVVRVIKRAGAGLADPRRPQGVFLFAGPTGVGKTELALALTQALFDNEEAIFRLDMSEFMDKHQVARLTGAPPGYVGYDDEGRLTGRLRRYPYSVILLDEIEKAHPEVQHLFLQLFDSGRLTDSQGRLADGRNAIFIMTTNLGAKEALGLAAATQNYQDKLQAAINDHFTMEFINRIDRIVYFNPLAEAALLAIFERELQPFRAKLEREHGLEIEISEADKQQLVAQIAQQKQGARPLRRFIEDRIIAPLVDKLLAGELQPGKHQISLELESASKPPPARPDEPPPFVFKPGLFNLGASPAVEPPPSPPASPPGRPAEPEAGLPSHERIPDAEQAEFDGYFLELAGQLFAQEIALEIESIAKFWLCAPDKANQKPREGRSIRQAFDELVLEPLTDKLVAQEYQAGDWLKIDYKSEDRLIEIRKV